MRCAPSTLPARGCGLGRQRHPGKVKASWGGRGPPDTQGSGPRRWDLSAQSQGGGGRGPGPAAPWGGALTPAPRRRPPATGVAVRSRRPGAASAGSRRSRRAGVSVSGANFRRAEVARRIGAMSGDSSGRRPEGRGRGRGRDPHRDRTRSRSRSRSPLSSGSRRGAAPERREAPERPSLEEEEPSDSGDEMVDPASLEEEPDHGLCRQIRHQYRALINSVQRKAGRGPRGGRCGTQALRSRRLGGAGGSAAPGAARRGPPHPSRRSSCTTLAGARRSPLGRTAQPEAGRRPSLA